MRGVGLGLGLTRGGAPRWTPKALGEGLKLWLRADGLTPGTITAWPDRSGNGRDGTHITLGPTAIASHASFAGKPVVYFDGTEQLDFASHGAATSVALYIVLKNDADPAVADASSGLWTMGTSSQSSHVPYSDGIIYDDAGSTARKTVGDPASSFAATARIYSVYSGPGSFVVKVDGVQIFTTGTNTFGMPATPTLGKSAGAANYKGHVAEFLLVSPIPVAALDAKVIAYSKSRYAIT